MVNPTPAFKIDTKIDEVATEGITPYVQSLYDHRGSELTAIVTFSAVDRSQPIEDSNIRPYVKARLTVFEAATTPKQTEALRQAQAALFAARTSDGVLDPDGSVELCEGAVKSLAGDLNGIKAAELQAVIDALAFKVVGALNEPVLNVNFLRNELVEVRDILTKFRTAEDLGDTDA